MTPATVIRIHRTLHALLEQGVRWGWLERNVADNVTLPHAPQADPEAPSIEDFESVLDQVVMWGLGLSSVWRDFEDSTVVLDDLGVKIQPARRLQDLERVHPG